MKKFVFLTVLVAVFALALVPAVTLAAIGDDLTLYGSGSGLGTADLRTGIMKIINILLGFLGILAIVIMLYGGFTWMTAAGNEEKVAKAKQIIGAGIIGLVIIFISYSLANFVIKSLISATA